MHIADNFPIADYRDKENEANRFASEFLMPESEIRNQLFNLKLNDLGNLKNYWLTSMSSIVKRASYLSCIDSNKTTYFNIELSRKGYRKTEPFEPYIDELKMFRLAYDLYTKELGYTHNEMSKAFSLPIDIIDYIFKFKSIGKLRLLSVVI